MKKQQSGLNLCTIRGVTVAKLYSTIVAEIDRPARVAIFCHGGWRTRATVKAINAALLEAGITAYSAHLERGDIVIRHGQSGGVAFGSVDRLVLPLNAGGKVAA